MLCESNQYNTIQWAHLTADFLTGILEKAQMEVITVIKAPFYLGGPVSQCEHQVCETETTEQNDAKAAVVFSTGSICRVSPCI